ncbi:MAG: hypothetical protein ABIS06_20775 [Vicinamibacterales bacterium]
MAKKTDTSEYSASQAPETRPAAEERDGESTSTLIPGGAHASPTAQGMAGLDRHDHPQNGLKNPKQKS